ATYVVTQADIDNAQIDNVATVTGTSPDTSTVQDTDTNTVTTPQNPAIRLIKTVTPPDPVPSVGDELTYEFTITNDGDVTLTGVTVTDPLPGLSAISCSTSVLAPGQSDTCSATYTVDQDDVDNGSVANTATVSGTSPDGSTFEDTDSALVSPGQAPSISLDKDLDSNADEDSSGNISAGDTLTFTFEVNNTGNVTLTSVGVTDPLTGLSPVTCPVSVITPGATIICTATYSVTQADVNAGSIGSTATTTGTPPIGGPIADTDPHTTPVPQSPSIDLVKTLAGNADEDGSGSLTVGDTLTYQFDMTNDGNVNLASVSVTDPLPGLSSITCSTSVLTPTQSTTCTATYGVTQSDIDNGSVDNTASASATPPQGGSVMDTDSVGLSITQAPEMDLAKTVGTNADEDGSGDVSVDDTLTYEFAATNTGNVTLTDLEVADPLVGLSAISCSSTTLAPGGTTTCAATYTVTQADVDAGSIPNTATASVEGPGGDPTDPTDDVTATDSLVTGVPRTPAIDLVKDLDNNADEDGSGDISVGDTLTYTYDVTNTGNVSLTTV
ncbi:MAG: DUF11 domain-containing protein, partial [Actinomycetia bacterium]|nr:DUF11 domain-containing protein [Actinomycetes bacterium]